MKTAATLDPDGTTFTMARGAWMNSYPLTDLSKWIAFYRRQAESVPGQPSYVDDVRALEGLIRQVRTTLATQVSEIASVHPN